MNNNAYQKTLNAYQRRTDASSLNNDWSSDIENVLEQIRVNCVIMSKEHKTKYLFLKGILRYFRIPIILISSIASVASVGLQPYLDQPTISVITCLLSLTCGIIGSIELFLAIQSSMENELMASKDYYILSIEIFKVLTLDRENRSMDGKSFLETSYGTYVKLVENSNILDVDEKIADRLTLVIDKNIDKSSKYIDTSSSDESPVSQSNTLSRLSSYWNNKKDKKINIEKTKSIDELVGYSLKKNNMLSLDQPLPPIYNLPQIYPPPPPMQATMQAPIQTPIQTPIAPTTIVPSIQTSIQTTIQPPQPPMQTPQPLIYLASRSSSYNDLSDLFTDNLSNSFFYNNFAQLPKISQLPKIAQLPKLSKLSKSISDSNLQHSSNNSSNINIDTINNVNGNIDNANGNNNEEMDTNDDIIGISEHNLIDIQ
jgi:hypothetical protein